MLIRVESTALPQTCMLIADVDGLPGFTPSVFLGLEPEGHICTYRFALSGSEMVIALFAWDVVQRVLANSLPIHQ